MAESRQENMAESRQEKMAKSQQENMAESQQENRAEFRQENRAESLQEKMAKSRQENMAESRQEKVAESCQENMAESHQEKMAKSQQENMTESCQENTAKESQRESCDSKVKIIKRSLVTKKLQLIRGKTVSDSQCPHEETAANSNDTTKVKQKSLELQTERNRSANSTESQQNDTLIQAELKETETGLKKTEAELKETEAEIVTKIVTKLTTETSSDKIKESKAVIISEDLEFLYRRIRKSSESTADTNLIISAIVKNKFYKVLENILNIFKDEQCSKMKSMANWYEYKKILSISWIVSDRSSDFCQHIVKYPSLVQLLVELLKMLTMDSSFWKTQWVLYTVKSILGILHNVHRHADTARDVFRMTNLVTVLKQTAESEVDMIRAKCFIIMSYIISEGEISALNADDKILKFLIDILVLACDSVDHFSKKYGMCVTEIVQGLNNLSVNEDNKVRLAKLGIVPLYLALLRDYRQEEVLYVVTGLWKLSFHPKNKKLMKDSGCVQVLEGLKQSNDERIRHSALGALWELGQELPNLDMISKKAELEASCPHIMISYQWDSQRTMVKVKDRLKSAGYKVWMDVEHMSGSTLEAMALAVEKSSVILICMSQKYKDSPSCRSEAEYVYKLRKSFVPLRLQTEYIPDGWLGIMIGTKLYFDFSKDSYIEEQTPNLIKELGDRGKVPVCLNNVDTFDGMTSSSRYVSKVTKMTSGQYTRWTTQEVCQWIQTLNLSVDQQKFSALDGELLMEMKYVLNTSPEFLYHTLQTEFRLTFVDILRLIKALRNL